MQHSPISASSTDRVLNCPGSVNATRDLVSKSSDYADEGTMCHAAAEAALREGRAVHAGDFAGVDADTQNELIRATQLFVDTVNQVRTTAAVQAEWIEQRFIHSHLPDFGGTADYAAICIENNRVICDIVDFKAGIGIPVYAPGNKQLLSYCALVADAFPLPIEEFRLTVVQPRNRDVDDVQRWTCFADRVDKHLNAVILASKQSWFSAGSHCRFCPAATNCSVLHNVIREIKETDAETQSDEMVERWIQIHNMATVIRNTLEKIQDKLVGAAKDGSKLPGNKIVERRSHRKWTEPDEKMYRLLADRGMFLDDSCKSTLKTPKQIQDLLKDSEKYDADQFKDLFTDYCKTEVIGYKVVDEQARGQPVDFHQFDPITE